jgi:hypothetical protein
VFSSLPCVDGDDFNFNLQSQDTKVSTASVLQVRAMSSLQGTHGVQLQYPTVLAVVTAGSAHTSMAQAVFTLVLLLLCCWSKLQVYHLLYMELRAHTSMA